MKETEHKKSETRGKPESQIQASDLTETVDDTGEGLPESETILAVGSEAVAESFSNAKTLLEDSQDESGSDSGGALLESGDSLGRLEVGEILGQGAFGVVVAAFDPDLKRKLAIKLLKPEVFESKSGRDAHKRLLREAWAMAKISHVNVVTVHDIGTVDGQVYITMEFVEGGNLSQWLRKAVRSQEEIMRVFVQAGRGLAAAHREGLVHRDFKPDNVLVNKDGDVRVADFGLVSISEKRGEALASGDFKLTRSQSGELDLTRAGAMMGTALYMSPEQHLGDEVTAASDQFSYCVALYAALYRRGPFTCRNYKELRKAVISGEVLAPPKNTSVPKWIHAVILRGLSVEVKDRYGSMPELIEALCNDPSQRRSRRLKMVGAGIVGLGLVAMLFWSQTREKEVCKNSAAGLEHVWDAVSKERLAAAFAGERASEFPRFEQSINQYTSKWVSVRTEVCEATHVLGEQSDSLLDRRMVCLDQRLSYLASVLAQLQVGVSAETLDKAVKLSISLPDAEDCTARPEREPRVSLPQDEDLRASVLAANRVVDEAEAHYDLGSQKRAIEILEALLGEPLDYPPTLAKATSVLGKSQVDLGDLEAGEKHIRESIEHGTRAGDDTLVASSWLALMHLDGIEREDYRRGYDHGKMAGLAMVRGQAGPLALAMLKRSRASLLLFEGKSKEALKILESILPLVEAEGNEAERSTLRTSLADAEAAEGDYEAALAHYKLALAHVESALGPEHPDNIYILNNMAVSLKRNRDAKGAREALQRSLAITERSFGPSVRSVVTILNNLGNIYRRDGDLEAAKTTLKRAIAVGEATMEEGHPTVTKSMMNLAIVFASEKNYAGASEAFGKVLKRSQVRFKDDHPDTAMALNNLGESLFLEEKFAESLVYALQALEMKVRIYGDNHPKIASTVVSLGSIYQSLGKLDEAKTHFEKALEIFHETAGEDHPRTILTLSLLGRLHESRGAASKASPYLKRAIAARGSSDLGESQAIDRFAMVRVLRKTRGRKAALAAAGALEAELGEAEATAAVVKELKLWIAKH